MQQIILIQSVDQIIWFCIGSSMYPDITYIDDFKHVKLA